MRHAEERDRVPRGNLEIGQVLHVCLGAAAPVEELVDVEDPHLVSSFSDSWHGYGLAPA
jgi:hypothetical protein